MASKALIPSAIFLISLLFASTQGYKIHPRKPCKELVFFYHDILFNGNNRHNATSAIVGSPAWGNKTTVAVPYSFGDMIVFNDPITLDNNLHSAPIGRAQGMYFYDMQDTYSAWFCFTLLFNSTEHRGTITLAGADPMMNKTREFSVIGGTGDFFMTRGIAIIQTDTFEGDVYFRLRFDIKLYECWK